MTKPLQRFGTMSFENGMLIVYKATRAIKCDKCFHRIDKNELVTKKKTEVLCSGCRPIEMDKICGNRIALNRFILCDEWFHDANGNALDLVKQIAEAAGYTNFTMTRGYANMVGWHLAYKYNELLSARFFCLLNEVADKFPVRKSEVTLSFAESFQNQSPGPRAS